jgi:hypothetical protein
MRPPVAVLVYVLLIAVGPQPGHPEGNSVGRVVRTRGLDARPRPDPAIIAEDPSGYSPVSVWRL